MTCKELWSIESNDSENLMHHSLLPHSTFNKQSTIHQKKIICHEELATNIITCIFKQTPPEKAERAEYSCTEEAVSQLHLHPASSHRMLW
jgi:hypothetical protein